VKRGDDTAYIQGPGRLEDLGVRVKGNLDVIAEPLAQERRFALHQVEDTWPGQVVLFGGQRIGLEGAKPVLLPQPQGILQGLLGRCAARVLVDADAFPAPAPQQLIHGDAERLALDVPQGMIDRAQRREEHCASRKARTKVDPLPDSLNVQRIQTDQPILEVVDYLRRRQVRAHAVGLAHALKPLVGGDLHKAEVPPADLYQIRGDGGDLHVELPRMVRRDVSPLAS